MGAQDANDSEERQVIKSWTISFQYSDNCEQCDERLPRCSRCDDLDEDCRYPNEEGQSQSMSSSKLMIQTNDTVSDDGRYLGLPSVSPRISGTHSGEHSSASSPPTGNLSALSPALHGDETQVGIPSSLSTSLLDARDLELLSHYLSHASRTIAYDRDDLYALHVGIPNLAFSSKPLMSSMLALAAACQCHDLLAQSPDGPDMARIQELLVLAEQHHGTSLRQIQEDIPSTQRYDHVLANAALMVLYGSASHWVRIRLAGMCEARGMRLPGEFVPVQSQWMSLIRAVHSAYVGLLADQAQNPGMTEVKDCVMDSPPHRDFGDVDVACPQDGPSDETRLLFLPIAAATSKSAMKKLRARARQVERRVDAGVAGLQVCVEALGVLETIIRETLGDRGHTSFSPGTPGSLMEDQKEPGYLRSLGRLSNVAPWLRNYTARVTMNSTDSRPLRRTVNAFLNRVPTAFLHMVQATLERIPLRTAGHDANRTQETSPEYGDSDSAAHRLAMDIFAHWLVLMLLLDGVWWIGGIGAWELGRVVAYMREGGRVDEGDGVENEAWWPESMYIIRMELSRYT